MMFYSKMPPLCMANRVLGFKNFTLKNFDITYIFKRRKEW